MPQCPPGPIPDDAFCPPGWVRVAPRQLVTLNARMGRMAHPLYCGYTWCVIQPRPQFRGGGISNLEQQFEAEVSNGHKL